MKNIIQYLITGFIGLAMFFRSGSFLPAADKPKDKDADVIKLTLADDGKTIKAATGKKIEISLKGNPTTGFEWRMVEQKSDVVKADGKGEYVKGEYVPDKNDPPRVGSGGTFVFKFTTAKPGKATLKFEYLRPWEKDKAPAQKFSVNLVVAEK
jgi:inhibitor of cysteine peptidase